MGPSFACMVKEYIEKCFINYDPMITHSSSDGIFGELGRSTKWNISIIHYIEGSIIIRIIFHTFTNNNIQ